jgi:hypothetical protein
LSGLEDARARYTPVAGSPALKSGSGKTGTLVDALDEPRSASAPSAGAIEQAKWWSGSSLGTTLPDPVALCRNDRS